MDWQCNNQAVSDPWETLLICRIPLTNRSSSFNSDMVLCVEQSRRTVFLNFQHFTDWHITLSDRPKARLGFRSYYRLRNSNIRQGFFRRLQVGVSSAWCSQGFRAVQFPRSYRVVPTWTAFHSLNLRHMRSKFHVLQRIFSIPRERLKTPLLKEVLLTMTLFLC